MSTDPAVIVGAARTPFGRFGGPMAPLRIPELGAHTARAALERAGMTGDDVDELVLGVNLPGSDRSIARQVALRAGVPEERVAYTVDRACCSSLTATSLAARAIRSGDATVVLAGGAENMSRVPYFLEDMRWGKRLGNIQVTDQLVISCPHTGVPRAVQAANESLKYGIGREEQDAWALRSQLLAWEATESGRFSDELIPLEVQADGGEPVSVFRDEALRPNVTLADLEKLPTVYGSATVTAGNAPGLSTGSSFLVLTTATEADRRGQAALATLLATARVSAAPEQIASVPATAMRMALANANVDLEDIDVIEINEAFAAVPLVSTWLLGNQDPAAVEALRNKTNLNGGAIALGHPTGATAARLLMTTAYELRRRGGGLGLVGICGGIGEAESAVLRVEA